MLSQRAVKYLVKKQFGNKVDLLTPETIGYGTISKKLVYKITANREWSDYTPYSVKVLEVEDKLRLKRRQDLEGIFHSRDEAEGYVEQLKKESQTNMTLRFS